MPAPKIRIKDAESIVKHSGECKEGMICDAWCAFRPICASGKNMKQERLARARLILKRREELIGRPLEEIEEGYRCPMCKRLYEPECYC